jgi:hypothetical protein
LLTLEDARRLALACPTRTRIVRVTRAVIEEHEGGEDK